MRGSMSSAEQPAADYPGCRRGGRAAGAASRRRSRTVTLLDAVDGRYRYAVEAGEGAAPVLSAAAFRAGFALYALAREQRTLETVFAEINSATAQEQRDAA